MVLSVGPLIDCGVVSGDKLNLIQSREQRYPRGLSAREKEAQSLPSEGVPGEGLLDELRESAAQQARGGAPGAVER